MKNKVSFDEMPEILASLVVEVKNLSKSVEVIVKKEKMKEEVAELEDSHGRNILTVDELSAYLKKSRSTIYRLVHSGDIPYIKKGRSVSFYEDEIKQWMEASRGRSIEDMLNQHDVFMGSFIR